MHRNHKSAATTCRSTFTLLQNVDSHNSKATVELVGSHSSKMAGC